MENNNQTGIVSQTFSSLAIYSAISMSMSAVFAGTGLLGGKVLNSIAAKGISNKIVNSMSRKIQSAVTSYKLADKITNNFITETAISLPATYVAQRLTIPRTEQQNFGEILRDSIIGDIAFRGILGATKNMVPKMQHAKKFINFNKSVQRTLSKGHSFLRTNQILFKNLSSSFYTSSNKNKFIDYFKPKSFSETLSDLATTTLAFKSTQKMNHAQRVTFIKDNKVSELFKLHDKPTNNNFIETGYRTENNFQYYKGFDSLGSGIGLMTNAVLSKVQLGGISISKAMGIDKLLDPNIEMTHATVLKTKQAFYAGSEFSPEMQKLINSGDSPNLDKAMSIWLTGNDENAGSQLVQMFTAANTNNPNLGKGYIYTPDNKNSSVLVSNTGLFHLNGSEGSPQRIGSLKAFTGIEEDANKFITVSNHDKKSMVAGKLAQTINPLFVSSSGGDTLSNVLIESEDNIITQLFKLTKEADNYILEDGSTIPIKELNKGISAQQTELNYTVKSNLHTNSQIIQLSHEILQTRKLKELNGTAKFFNVKTDKNIDQQLNGFINTDSIISAEDFDIYEGLPKAYRKEVATILKDSTKDISPVGREQLRSALAMQSVQVKDYKLGMQDAVDAIVFKEVVNYDFYTQHIQGKVGNDLDDKFQAMLILKNLENSEIDILDIVKDSNVKIPLGKQANAGTFDINNPYIIQALSTNKSATSSMSHLIKSFSSDAGIMLNSQEHFFNITEFSSIAGYYDAASQSYNAMPLERLMSEEFKTIFTTNKAINVSMMASTNELASSFGLGVDFGIHESPGLYVGKLFASNTYKLGVLGLGLYGLDSLVKTEAFEGSKINDGLLPFGASIIGDVFMASREIANITGITATMGLINNAIPGIVQSPIGAATLGIAPLMLGYMYGRDNNNMITSMLIGGAGSMILSGGISGIFGSYDLTKSDSDYFNELTGGDNVAIRNSRNWALNDSSFLGTNVNHFGKGFLPTLLTSSGTTANIDSGTINFVSGALGVGKNNLSRPYGNIEEINTLTKNEIVNNIAINNYETTSDVLGLRGFAFKSITKQGLASQNMAGAPQLANPEDAFGLGRRLQNSQLGGGLGQTEYFRRILQTGKNTSSKNIVNPIRNTMPDWLPGFNYMNGSLNFKEGDPYIKITNGEIRLPGTGHLSQNKPKLDLPFDLNLMGYSSKQEYITNISRGGLSKNKVHKASGIIKQNYIQMAEEASGIDLKVNKAYYKGNNIIANSDFELEGTAYKLEVVDSEQFLVGQQTDRFQKKADLLATISGKSAKVIVINGETRQELVFNGELNDELLNSEIKVLDSMKGEIYQAIQKTGLGFHNAYSIVDRFLVLADTSPYSEEFRNYKDIVKAMLENGELQNAEVSKVAQALKRTEKIISGVSTGTKSNMLSKLLPNKFIHPDYIDPLDSYLHTFKLSSGMKQWSNPAEYVEDDFTSAISGDISMSKQFIGSLGLYGFLYGPQNAVGISGVMAGLAGVSEAMGGTHISTEYDQGRELLSHQAALDFARGDNSIFASVIDGENEVDQLISQLPKGDRQYASAFTQVQNKKYREEIYSKVSDPTLKYVLAKAYGYADTSSYSIKEQGYAYLDSIDQDSSLFDSGVDSDYMVIQSALDMELNPKGLGMGFDIQEYKRSVSPYADTGLYDSNTKSIEYTLKTKLSFLGEGIAIEVKEFGDTNHIEVVIYNNDR